MTDKVYEVLKLNLKSAEELMQIADRSNDEYLKRRAREDLTKWQEQLKAYESGNGTN